MSGPALGSSAPAPPPSGEVIRWSLLSAAYASLFVLGLSDNSRGPLFPQILADLALSDAAGSWMFGVTSAGLIAGSLGLRPVVTRYSARVVLQGSLLGMGAALASMGLAPELWSLLAASLALGVALGGLALAQNLMVEQAVPQPLQRRAFSGLHSMYGVASLLAPLLIALSEHAGLSWRRALMLLALPSLALAGATQLLARGERGPGAPARVPAPLGPLGWGPLTVAGMTGSCVVAELLLSTRIPLLLRREGLAPEVADLYLSAFFACLLAGRLGVTFLPLQRISSRALLTCSALGGLALFSLGLWREPRLLPLVALFVAPFFPVATSLLAEEYPGRLERSMSVLMAWTSLLLTLAHGGVGWLSEAVGLRAALWIGPASLVACLALLLANTLLRRRAEARA